MAKSRKNAKKGSPAPGGVVRRPAAERKRLPPDLEAFARSEDTRLRSSSPRRPRLRDPRPAALVPGVANRDARRVYDRRVEELKAAIGPEGETHAEERLAELLAEAVQMGVWRGRSVTGLGAFAQDVLGLPEDRARALAERGAAHLGGPDERRTDEAVAAWFRAEASLLEDALPGRVRVIGRGSEERLVLELPIGEAPAALHAVGRRMTPLVRDQEEAASEAEERARREARKRRPPERG